MVWMLSDDAILFYADEPIYFVEDIIRVTPDQKQRDIPVSYTHLDVYKRQSIYWLPHASKIS